MLYPRMLLSGLQFALCVVLGVVLGAGMIVTHTGPGINQRQHAQGATPESRNLIRTENIEQLKTALIQYQKDHGSLPIKLTNTATQICGTFGPNCQQVHMVDLSFLMTGGNYLPAMPLDPLGSQQDHGAGYFIQRQLDGSLTLTAPEAEAGRSIAVHFTP